MSSAVGEPATVLGSSQMSSLNPPNCPAKQRWCYPPFYRWAIQMRALSKFVQCLLACKQTQGSFLLPLFYEWNIKQGNQLCEKSGKETDMQGEREWNKNSGHLVWMDYVHVNKADRTKGLSEFNVYEFTSNQTSTTVRFLQLPSALEIHLFPEAWVNQNWG